MAMRDSGIRFSAAICTLEGFQVRDGYLAIEVPTATDGLTPKPAP
jgi:hypothetical protein